VKKVIICTISVFCVFSVSLAYAQAPAGVPGPYKKNFQQPQEVDAGAVAQPQPKEVIQNIVPHPQGPMDPHCREQCRNKCKCAYELGMGGPMFGMLFSSYSNEWGEINTPKYLMGGRGFGYLLDGRLRLGGGGAAIISTEDGDEGISVSSGGRSYFVSKGRTLTGGYGGFIAQYVLNIGRYVRVPMGTLVGFGGGGFISTMSEDVDKKVYTMFMQGGPFVALQPMLECQILATDEIGISAGATYLWAEAFGDAGDFGGFGFMLGLDFGRLRPLEL